MTQRLIPTVALLFFLAATVFAQVPRNIQIIEVSPDEISTSRSGAMMCDAGSISFTFDGQSNDADGTVKYLCSDDCLNVIHDGDFDFNDPQPSTPSGIGYIFYDCEPTVTGPTITDVINDPCTNHTDPIWVGNTPVPQLQGVWITTDTPDGNLKILNDGGVQQTFSANRTDPIQFWFAPITLHIHDASIPEYGFEVANNVEGCVDVSTDQAFSVVYLNEVEINSLTPVLGGGTFTVRGGLSEFDEGATNYTISIVNIDDPSVTGTVTSGNATDGSTVEFTVPQDGCYTITVEDGKACPATAEICTFLQPVFEFSLQSVTVPPGATTCLSATVSGFENIGGFEMGIAFDPTIVSFESATQNPSIPANFVLSANVSPFADDVVNVNWFDFSGAGGTASLGNDEALFDICFEAVGMIGECSPLTFGDLSSGNIPQITIGNAPPFDETFFAFNDGEICINNAGLDVNFSDVFAECTNSGDEGGFTITVSNGTPPYNVSWQDEFGMVFGPQSINSEGGSAIITGLQSGVYNITVTDAAAPSLSYTGDIEIGQGDIGVNAVGTIISCFGGMDGEVSVQILQGGVVIPNPDPMQYTYNWERDGEFLGDTPVITGLGVGPPVEVTVTNNNTGCEAVGSTTLSQNAEIVLDSVQLVNPECPGFANGEVRVFVGGGVPPYSYVWDSPLGTDNPVLFGVGAGTYTVSVSDANDCGPLVQTFELLDPAPIAVNLTNAQDVSCFNSVLCDGQMTAEGIGGNSGVYTFNWSNGVVEMDVTNSTVTNLCQGMHTVSVSEGNCGIDTTFVIGSPDSLGLDINGTTTYSVSCFGTTDGSIQVAAQGGVSPYNYTWNINGSTIQSDSVSNLSPGTYSVTIEDANGCLNNTSLLVGEPDPLEVLIDSMTTTPTVQCEGDENGVIAVFPIGGNSANGNLTYDWSPDVSEFSTATGLSAGTYTVVVTDSRGCSNLANYTITEPTPVSATIPQPDMPACAGDRTTLTVDAASGGAGGPYTFSINNGVAGAINNAVDLLAGEYLVTVFDANECAYEEIITIQDPPPLMVDLGADITIELGESTQLDGFFFGPNALDSIIWTPTVACADSTNNNCLDPFVMPLETTEYTLTVFDTRGCFSSDNIIVEVDKDRNVYIPNAFSPDSDGINDFFTPLVGPGVTNVKSMQIFDRWGELVFSQENFLPQNDFGYGWDGRFRGKFVNNGVFVYLIEVEFQDGVSLLYRGDILVLY